MLIFTVTKYVLREWKSKYDLADDDEDDTLTFKMKKTFIFRPDLSRGLTGNEEITTVNVLIMVMVEFVVITLFSFPPFEICNGS